MKLEILDEPELEFGSGARHVDIRFGLMDAGPLDVLSPPLRGISVGMVGTAETLEGLARWLDRCRGRSRQSRAPMRTSSLAFQAFAPTRLFGQRCFWKAVRCARWGSATCHD
jgi:hypothetical protein